MKKTGLYIHIPFCVQKCNYCAFLSFNAESSPRKEYTDALVQEIRRRGEAMGHPEVDTVYVGGGTPSVLDLSQMRDIMTAVSESFRVKPDAEMTIEANPGTLGRKDGVTLAKLQAYRYIGFNRLSMGVQSMDNDRLHFLGRIHTAENVARDMELIRRKGFENVNLDLIFSVPGESTADALSDLRKVLALRPEHVSCYSLQIEEGTPFGRMAEAGELSEVSDEEDRRTYHEICRALKDAGYEHYEISNFARLPDGCGGRGFADAAGTGAGAAETAETGTGAAEAPSQFRSQHNSLYWSMDDYIGLGLGASGFAGGVRYKNTDDIEEYFEAIKEGRFPLTEENVNTPFDNISEAVFTGLRRREGITYEEAAAAYMAAGGSSGTASEPAGSSASMAAGGSTSAGAEQLFWQVFADAEKEARGYADRGLLVIDNKGLRLTEQGIDISNSIMSLFV